MFIMPFEVVKKRVYVCFGDGISPHVGEKEGEDRAGHFAEGQEK